MAIQYFYLIIGIVSFCAQMENTRIHKLAICTYLFPNKHYYILKILKANILHCIEYLQFSNILHILVLTVIKPISYIPECELFLRPLL